MLINQINTVADSTNLILLEIKLVESGNIIREHSLARRPLAGNEGLDWLCYSSCANAKTLAGPIRFVDCYMTSFTVDMLQDLLQ